MTIKNMPVSFPKNKLETLNFNSLLPEIIFKALRMQGFRPTGVLYPLNSYENRVYEIGVEEGMPLVAKFYRPGRWSDVAIGEEHQFLKKLHEAEVPVVLPLVLSSAVKNISTLGYLEEEKLFYAFFPKFRGREHAEVTNDDRRWLGRTLARLHNVGEHFKTKHRLQLNPQTYGYQCLDFILSQSFLPSDLKSQLETYLLMALKKVETFFNSSLQFIPVHGDCHPGNVLWNNDGPHLLDFDDMVVAPPVQDIWMLFFGNEEEKREQRKFFFEGYEIFRKFDLSTLILTEPLRTLRMIRYAAWIGQRYEEEAFKRAFPYYRERRYWEGFIQDMKEQISLLQEISG